MKPARDSTGVDTTFRLILLRQEWDRRSALDRRTSRRNNILSGLEKSDDREIHIWNCVTMAFVGSFVLLLINLAGNVNFVPTFGKERCPTPLADVFDRNLSVNHDEESFS